MSDSPTRKHRATGRKPPGGKRPGAGRPPGTRNVLPKGAIQAVKALGLRVPEGTAPELVAVADRAFQRVVDVLEERVGFQQAGHVLKAATVLREEVCGPVATKVQHSGPNGEALTFNIDLGAGK